MSKKVETLAPLRNRPEISSITPSKAVRVLGLNKDVYDKGISSGETLFILFVLFIIGVGISGSMIYVNLKICNSTVCNIFTGVGLIIGFALLLLVFPFCFLLFNEVRKKMSK